MAVALCLLTLCLLCALISVVCVPSNLSLKSQKDDGILVIPTARGPPPKLEAKENFSKEYLIQTTVLSSLASMSGCCQMERRIR